MKRTVSTRPSLPQREQLLVEDLRFRSGGPVDVHEHVGPFGVHDRRGLDHRLQILERVDPADRDQRGTSGREGRRAVGDGVDAVVDHADLRRIGRQRDLPALVELGDGQHLVGGLERGHRGPDREAAEQVAHRARHGRLRLGDECLADEDSVLGQDEARPLACLGDDAEERGDARGGAVHDVGLERRQRQHGEQAPQDVQDLDHVSHRRAGVRGGVRPPLVGEGLPDRLARERLVRVVALEEVGELEEGVEQLVGRRLGAQHLARQARPGRNERRFDLGSVRAPPPGPALLARQVEPLVDVREDPPEWDRAHPPHVLRERVRRALERVCDDGDDVELVVGQPCDQLLAPRRDPAPLEGVGALGDQCDAHALSPRGGY